MLYSFIKKDLHLLFISTRSFSVSLLFSTCLLTLLSFLRFSPDAFLGEKLSYLYISFFISSLFILLYAQDSEKENGVYHLLKLLGSNFTSAYISKSIACSLALFSLWFFNVLLWSFFFDQQRVLQFIQDRYYIYWIGLLFSGLMLSISISFLGTIVARISLFSRFHLATFLILFFPLILPVVIASSQLSSSFLGMSSLSNNASLLSLASIFIYSGMGLLTYNILMED